MNADCRSDVFELICDMCQLNRVIFVIISRFFWFNSFTFRVKHCVYRLSLKHMALTLRMKPPSKLLSGSTFICEVALPLKLCETHMCDHQMKANSC